MCLALAIVTGLALDKVHNLRKEVAAQSAEIARLKFHITNLEKSNDEYFKANQTLQKSLADKAVEIENRDDRLEQLDNRNKLLLEDLDAKTVRLHRLESAVETVLEAVKT